MAVPRQFTVQERVLLHACGCVFFPCLYKFIRFAVKKYKETLRGEQLDMVAMKGVTAVHSILAGISGLLIVIRCQDNVLYDRHWLSIVLPCFDVPYYYFDTWALYKTFMQFNRDQKSDQKSNLLFGRFLRKRALIMFHHASVIFVFFPVLVYFRKNTGDFFVGCFYLVQLSEPFVCIRKTLSVLEMKKSSLYTATGIFMVVTYVVFGILRFPYMFWRYGRQHDLSLWQVPFRIPTQCITGSLVLLVPMFYWTLQMARGVYRDLTDNIHHRVYDKID